MKTKLIIGGIALAMTSMGNAKLPYLDPTHLPTLGSLISALNYGWADSIEGSIDAISAQAVQAETHASNAETHANNAETAAKTASNQADTAITTANGANTIAQQAATTVASFDTRLTTAESDAITAKKIAASADETAKGATQTAQTASTKVDSYDSRITAAESKATEAKQIADTAKQTADGIKATADAAKAAADKAAESATTATETANTAKTTADSAKASADKVDQFDQRITTAENNAKEAKTDAKKASDVADESKKYVIELDEKYKKQVDSINNRLTEERVYTPSINERNLSNIIKAVQAKFSDLSIKNPITIKLNSNKYTIDFDYQVPGGLIFEGNNVTQIEAARFGVTGSVDFKNLTFTFPFGKVEKEDIKQIIHVHTELNNSLTFRFENVNFAFPTGTNLDAKHPIIVVVGRAKDSQVLAPRTEETQPIGRIKLYFDNVTTQSAARNPKQIQLFGESGDGFSVDPMVDMVIIRNSLIGNASPTYAYNKDWQPYNDMSTYLVIINSVANISYQWNKNYKDVPYQTFAPQQLRHNVSLPSGKELENMTNTDPLLECSQYDKNCENWILS